MHRNRQLRSYSYDIHGIITLRSDVCLPELERFLTPARIEQPTILVRIGNVRAARAEAAKVANPMVHRLYFDEGLGRMGFAIAITVGNMIGVLASPLLRHSPHVLYTNVVEPILRWTFVDKGYVLVHAACVAFGDLAYLITARTDTGKTTTMLRILDGQHPADDGSAFVSDDMTILGPGGQILTYPKPLTISHHTVAAVNTPLLTRSERLALLLQSRIHSRTGRKSAHTLSRTSLPVATINAVVQWLVPPPKYHVQRLIPDVRAARAAQLAGMVVIERGEDSTVDLTHQEGFEILMRNCEDAYGYPPYGPIVEFLLGLNARDLRMLERDMIAETLREIPSVLMRSSRLDWSQRITALVRDAPSVHRG